MIMSHLYAWLYFPMLPTFSSKPLSASEAIRFPVAIHHFELSNSEFCLFCFWWALRSDQVLFWIDTAVRKKSPLEVKISYSVLTAASKNVSLFLAYAILVTVYSLPFWSVDLPRIASTVVASIVISNGIEQEVYTHCEYTFWAYSIGGYATWESTDLPKSATLRSCLKFFSAYARCRELWVYRSKFAWTRCFPLLLIDIGIARRSGMEDCMRRKQYHLRSWLQLGAWLFGHIVCNQPVQRLPRSEIDDRWEETPAEQRSVPGAERLALSRGESEERALLGFLEKISWMSFARVVKKCSFG